MDGLDEAGGAASASADGMKKTAWVTRADVEFLNSLHPRGGIEFPQMDDFIGDRWKLQQAFESGFRAVQDRWYATIPEVLGKLNKYETKIYFAVHARTLNFGKLFEKIPERHFRYGICNDDGTLKLGANGYPIFSPSGIYDHGNLSRTIKSLIKKKVISRFESDKHPVHGKSYIYTPMHAVDLWTVLVTAACSAYVGSNQFEEQHDWNSFATILRSRTRRLADEITNNERRAAAPAHKSPPTNELATVSASADQSATPTLRVRHRVRPSVHGSLS